MTSNPISNIPPLGPMTGQGPAGGHSPFKPVDPVRLMRQHMWLLIIVGLVGLMLGAGVYVGLRAKAPQYTATAYLHVSSPLQYTEVVQGLPQGTTRSLDEITAFIASETQRMKSDAILNRVMSRDEVTNTQWFRSFNGDRNKALLNLQESTIKASHPRGSQLIRLTASTRSKDDAAILLEYLMRVYLDAQATQGTLDAEERRTMYSANVERFRKEVDALTETLNRFTRDNDIDSINERDTAIRLQFDNLTKQRLALEYALNAEQANYDSLKLMEEQGGEPSADQVMEIMSRPTMQSRQQTINSMRSHISALLAGGYGPGHRSVKQAQEQLQAMESDLKAEQARLIRESMDARLSSSARAVENYRSQLQALVAPVTEARTRMTDVRAKIDEYAAISDRLSRAQLRLDQEQAKLDLIWDSRNHPNANRVRRQSDPDEAKLTFPKPLIVVPGITILVLGSVIGLLFLREMLDQRMRSPADAQMLQGVNMLGMLPDTSEDPSGATRIERVVERQPAGLMAESFRQVRSAILSRMDRRGYKSLLVCSAQPASGSTSVSQNLAASVALNGRRVLIIDANFRRPGQHHLNGVDNSTGLVEVLLGTQAPDEVIYPIEGMSLSIMPTGNAVNAAPELLEGQAFRSLMARLEAAFDLIVIDAPPTLLTSDSQLLVKQVDAVAMVVRAGVDKRGMVERMFRQLDGQRADVLGMILNGVRSSAGGYYRKSYQEFYRYGQPRNGASLPPPPSAASIARGGADDLAVLDEVADEKDR